MPKIVDHDSRRTELTAAAARIVSERGLDNATVRDIAREAGFSSSILAHYFRNKDDVFAHTLRALDERTRARFTPSLTGTSPVEEVIEAGMSADDVGTRDYRMRIHFWSRALSNPAFASDQASSFKEWIRSMRTLLRSRQKRGELEEDLDLDRISEVLIAIGIGVGVMSIFLPKRSRRTFVHRVVETATNALF